MFCGGTWGKTMRWITTIVVAIVLSSPARAQTRGGLDDLKAAGGGVGGTPCSEFNQSREKPEIEAMFFSWTEGYLTGWNLGLPQASQEHVECHARSKWSSCVSGAKPIHRNDIWTVPRRYSFD